MKNASNLKVDMILYMLINKIFEIKSVFGLKKYSLYI